MCRIYRNKQFTPEKQRAIKYGQLQIREKQLRLTF